MRAVRTLAVAGALGAIEVGLAVTGLGSVPLPTGLTVTVLAVPSILAGLLAGPLAGAAVGGVLGVTSLALATTPLFGDPLVAIVPRVLVGPIAALVYRACRPVSEVFALAVAGAAGAAASTALILVAAIVLPGPLGAAYLAPRAGWDVARSTIPSEAVVAALITVVVGLAARMVAARR